MLGRHRLGGALLRHRPGLLGHGLHRSGRSVGGKTRRPDEPCDHAIANGVIVEMKLPQGHGPAWGGIFIGEKGKIETNRNKCVSNPPELVVDKPKANYEWGVTRPHLDNWVDCMQSRERPRADVEIGHRSTTMPHVNIARDLGRRVRWDPDKEVFVGDDEANRHPSVRRRERDTTVPAIV